MVPHHLIYFIFASSARHGDGLYDSYMRTDHILKDEADTNSPSGLPPMPKHTVSINTHTHTRNRKKPYFLCWSTLCLQTSCTSERYSLLNLLYTIHPFLTPAFRLIFSLWWFSQFFAILRGNKMWYEFYGDCQRVVCSLEGCCYSQFVADIYWHIAAFTWYMADVNLTIGLTEEPVTNLFSSSSPPIVIWYNEPSMEWWSL